ncbi:MAG: macro domain-containing protein, partial [Kiritimatiellae bacterium]|nr:macro domain-containing protein [Kiritimatiellia bacterium]
DRGEPELLAQCYRNTLNLAVQHGIKTIAFPSISTGAYGYPISKACRIALIETLNFLRNDRTIEKVVFVCFSKDDYESYRKAWSELSLQQHATGSSQQTAPT